LAATRRGLRQLPRFSALLSGGGAYLRGDRRPSNADFRICEGQRDRANKDGAGLDTLNETSLPPPDTKRWVTRRKAEIVAAVRNGVISLDDACARYHISIEEFLSWQTLIERHGLAGLRVTRMQDYRAHATEE